MGTLAFGGVLYDPAETALYDGRSWHPAQSAFIVVNAGAECVGAVSFDEVVSHELGHGLGFGHHTPADPTDALMSAKLKADGRGAALRSLDRTCAAYAFHSFLDVPFSHPFWRHVEAIENAGITQGCGAPGSYCPADGLTRAEMAVFLVRSIHCGGFVPPPATGAVFEDVPSSHWAAAHVEQLFADGITKGCASELYCPESTVQRDQMAVFLVRARHGSGFVPPPATGTVFEDVPASHWAADYIEQLYADGVTAGCSTSPRRYCPGASVRRDEMAAFLARAFGLPLP